MLQTTARIIVNSFSALSIPRPVGVDLRRSLYVYTLSTILIIYHGRDRLMVTCT